MRLQLAMDVQCAKLMKYIEFHEVQHVFIYSWVSTHRCIDPVYLQMCGHAVIFHFSQR